MGGPTFFNTLFLQMLSGEASLRSDVRKDVTSRWWGRDLRPRSDWGLFPVPGHCPASPRSEVEAARNSTLRSRLGAGFSVDAYHAEVDRRGIGERLTGRGARAAHLPAAVQDLHSALAGRIGRRAEERRIAGQRLKTVLRGLERLPDIAGHDETLCWRGGLRLRGDGWWCCRCRRWCCVSARRRLSYSHR